MIVKDAVGNVRLATNATIAVTIPETTRDGIWSLSGPMIDVTDISRPDAGKESA